MRLLILTQKVDTNDTVLGFYAGWIAEFARRYEKITAVCLQKGAYDLPQNVSVHSLGKEGGRSRLKYVARFYRYAWKFRKDYDAVFVHMNQEYVLLGWPLWAVLGKPVYMWRNHGAGNLLTRLSVRMCRGVFCTSPFSYTAQFRKTRLMPVGVDTRVFEPKPVERVRRSILSLGRISPVKRIEVLLEACKLLRERGIDFSLAVIGDPLPQDEGYYAKLKELAGNYGIAEATRFEKGIPNRMTPEVYSAFDIFVNLAPPGMFDKTIIESMACGALAVVSAQAMKGKLPPEYIFEEASATSLAESLTKALLLSPESRERLSRAEQDLAAEHSLERLIHELSGYIGKN